MNVCTRCLYRNDDADAFCASCGTFLEWSGQKKAGTRPRPGPAPDGADRTARRRSPSRPRGPGEPAAGGADGSGGTRRARRLPDLSAPTGGSGPSPARRAAAAVDTTGLDPEAAALAVAADHLRRLVEENRRRRMGPARSPQGPSSPPPRSGPRPAGARPPAPAPAAPAVRPTPPLRPQAGGVTPQQPTLEQRRPARQAAVADDAGAHPGDVVCSRCGTGNAPSRHFCRRCGTPLGAAEPVAATASPAAKAAGRNPWWRRWWRRLLWWRHRDEEVPAAPVEPPGPRARALAAVPVVVVLALIAAALGPWRSKIGDGIETARKRFSPRYEQVYPAQVQGSSSLADHPPEASVDRAPNTYWAEGGPTAGEGEGLTFRFDRPADLGRLGFFNGAQTKPQDFLTQPRLRDVVLTFDTGETRTITLKDRDAFQNHAVDVKGVTTVRLRIVSVYPSPQGGTDASLGEVEFFTKS